MASLKDPLYTGGDNSDILIAGDIFQSPVIQSERNLLFCLY